MSKRRICPGIEKCKIRKCGTEKCPLKKTSLWSKIAGLLKVKEFQTKEKKH